MERPFSIRAATAGDMGSIAALFRTYARGIGVDLSYQGFEQELASLPGAYAPPLGALFIAVSATEAPIGCVAVRPFGEPGVCEMKRLHTLPDSRGAGIGSALAAAAIEAATQAGFATMLLDTLPSMTAALTVYRRLGFEVTSAYYDSPLPDTIFMRKALRRSGT